MSNQLASWNEWQRNQLRIKNEWTNWTSKSNSAWNLNAGLNFAFSLRMNNGARWILTEEWMLLNEFWRHNEWIRQRRQPRMNQLKEYWSWWMNWFMAGMNRLLLEWIALQWMRLEWSKKEMISELHELVCLIAN